MYLLLTKPSKYPGAANRLHRNHFHRKHCRIGYCQSLSAKTDFFFSSSLPLLLRIVNGSFVANKSTVSETFNLRRAEWRARKAHLAAENESLLWAKIYAFKISRPSTFMASVSGFILFVPTWWSISLRKRLWIIPISVTLQLNVIQRGSIGCCNSDAHKKKLFYLFIFLLITNAFSQHFAVINY